MQSPLIVEDALGLLPEIELRDGVQIDPATRTAVDKKKFDMELLRAGMIFPLRFELLVPVGEERTLRSALTLALRGLQEGEICLGARKRRGFGECRVQNWRICEYDLTAPRGRGLLGWLKGDTTGQMQGDDIAVLLGQDTSQAPDRRRRFRIQAAFWLDGSLLIRSGFGEADTGPDAIHLHRPEAGSSRRSPILPGTSLAGVIRQRALRIAQTLRGDNGASMIDALFGRGPIGADDKHVGGRVAVRETAVENVHSLVQNRIRIDRFTGGVLDNFLFNEAPVFGGPGSLVKLDVMLRNPSSAEIGLLLLVLKDLWTADLPVGGGANVGRGRLQGLHAELSQDGIVNWTLVQSWQGRQRGEMQVTGDRQALERYVAALNEEVAA
jgi:CRISPR/Cas system CSM-associated protein Csm3 (group 7 of RAMP superfamily)